MVKFCWEVFKAEGLELTELTERALAWPAAACAMAPGSVSSVSSSSFPSRDTSPSGSCGLPGADKPGKQGSGILSLGQGPWKPGDSPETAAEKVHAA